MILMTRREQRIAPFATSVKRLSEVQQDQLAAEYDEAAIIWAAMAENLPVQHRADCNPLAILQCTLITAPAGNGRGTSWMHAIDIIGLGR
jgi:hypothetical protein